MSSSVPRAENAAIASVEPEPGQEAIPGPDQREAKRWQSPPPSSTSLLTQEFAANQEAARAADKSQESLASRLRQTKHDLPQSHDELRVGAATANRRGDMSTMAMLATGPYEDGRTAMGMASTSSPSLFSSFLLSGHRDRTRVTRVRGTSLERTEKEKRVQSSPKGTYSTNPGDTALPPSPHVTRTPNSISNNPPTEGVRAKYRSWREPHPRETAEKAWSIGGQGTTDASVEKSIADAVAGVEPSSRSRKASQSLRLFKEGLPEDKTIRREVKTRASSSRANDGVVPENLREQSIPEDTTFDDDGLQEKSAEGFHSNGSIQTQVVEETSVLGTRLTKEQMRTLPPALLAEIRSSHVLNPGSIKALSQSLSANGIDTNNSAKTENDGSKNSPTKTSYDEESGEEHIASALFVPHHTSRKQPEREYTRPQRLRIPGLDEERRSDDSEQWLEEYSVPCDQNEKDLPLPPSQALQSPRHVETLSPPADKDEFPSRRQVQSPVEAEFLGVEAPSSYGEEAIDDDNNITPTSSYKVTSDFPSSYSQHLHDHQQQPRQPLEAIELIPYRHQVGGHTTLWRFSKRAICKQLNNRENEFYEKIERHHPQLLKFLPRYIGVLNVMLEKQPRRKSVRYDDAEASKERQATVTAVDEERNSVAGSTLPGNSSTHVQPTEERVISQSLKSSSVPVPKVTFADNRHIIPKSFMQPHPYVADLQQRSKSDSASHKAIIEEANASPPAPDSDITYRPSLSTRHAVSWGATTVNKQLRNEVFTEAFLNKPIPVYRHKRPASQHRLLPVRHTGASLRPSNSESSLKTAQQSQTASEQPEESIRRKAIKAAAEQRNMEAQSASSTQQESEEAVDDGDIADDEDAELDEKTGTSAPEPEIARSPHGKRQRRYSSGGLRRKPAAVADSRGSLKYFEEADDVSYKSSAEEDVFPMDLELAQKEATSNESEPANSSDNQAVRQATELPRPAGSVHPNPAHVSRPSNPKEALTQPDSRVEYFLLLEDLTAGMKRPCIMDLKMGTRQYGVDANEKKQKSQRRKCADTTSHQLGVRVCGLQVWNSKTQSYLFQDKYFGRDLKVGREFQDALKRFLYDGVDYSSALRHIPTILKKLSQLEHLIEGLAGYRFYAASLLMFYDANTEDEYESDSSVMSRVTNAPREIDFKIADFANCVTKEDMRSSERSCPPQHPESPDRGFLRGLRSLRHYFLAIQDEIRDDAGIRRNDFSTSLTENLDEGDVSY